MKKILYFMVMVIIAISITAGTVLGVAKTDVSKVGDKIVAVDRIANPLKTPYDGESYDFCHRVIERNDMVTPDMMNWVDRRKAQ